MKKITTIMGLFFLIVIGLCSCGKKSESNNSSVMASKDYVYKIEALDFFDEGQIIDQFIREGNTIYAYGFDWSEDIQSTVLSIYQLNDDGTLEESYSIPVEENSGMGSLSIDEDKNIYCIITRSRQLPVEVDPETGEALTEEMEYIEEYYLTKMNLQGEEIYSINLNEVPEFQKIKEENGYFYIRDLMLDHDKAIYLSVLDQLAEFDLEGNFVKMMVSGQNELEGASFILLNDGSIAARMYEEDGMVIALADLEKGTVGEKYKLPGLSYDYSCYPGIGYDLYLVNSSGLYGYNIGDADKTQLMNYVDSDIDVYSLNNVMAINERQFFALYYDMDTIPALFTKVEPKDVKDKKQITLAMVYTDWGIRQEVVKFNKSNEEYRISIMDYNSLYGSDSDYMAGINKLNTDIVSGKVPDILLIDSSMPIDSYINKGLFEDLKPYINKDEELDINNFMPNIVEAFSVDEKLYTLVPSYFVQTLVAKTSDVGDERGWTVQEALDILASKPEGTQLLDNATREEMLNYCMNMAGSQFVDWEKGSCSFNSEGFVQMLEFIKSFPEKVNYDELDDNYWRNRDSMWREGKILAAVRSFYDFRNYNYAEKGTFGEKITMIGFPTTKGDGTVIYPSLQLAMSAKAQNKDGIWEFLRNFLLDEYQESNSNYDFPLSIKRLNELGVEATQKLYYLDENGNKVEYDDTYYIGEIEVVIPPMTEQEVEDLKEQLYSITDVYKYDESLINIIKEEAAPYFAGQKSAGDVAAIIQSRAQIYLSETR